MPKLPGCTPLEATISLCRQLRCEVRWIHLSKRGLVNDTRVMMIFRALFGTLNS